MDKYIIPLKSFIDKETIFRAGDKVIFSPDDNFIAPNNGDFSFWNLYPGKIVTIKGITPGEGKYSGLNFFNFDQEAAILSNQFILYNENEKCNFEVNDFIRFSPIARTRQNSPGRFGSFGLKVNQEYVVRRIVNDVWVFVDEDIYGFYWKDFSLVKKGELKGCVGNKTVEELAEDVLSFYKYSEKDKIVERLEDDLSKHLRDLKSGNGKLVRLALKSIENVSMGGMGRMITLELHTKKEIKTKDKEWNEQYNNTVYELYWAARRINDSIENLK